MSSAERAVDVSDAFFSHPCLKHHCAKLKRQTLLHQHLHTVGGGGGGGGGGRGGEGGGGGGRG